ncbi:hypothetical protein [Fundidesulfovibrio soli]|uniref:hypothetical protein n=1 Tax=Fundidesulfovibrio soli TaxID=2922716 RepID=UPI001FAE7957|nr:hypothetical protein [Fundidesulfovibrio soli]
MSLRPAAAALLALAALGAGCGKDEYPPKVRENFTVACLDSSKDTLSKMPGMGEAAVDKQAKTYCNCVLEKMVAKMPYKDFVEMNAALEKGESPTGARAALLEGIIAECGGAALEPKN